MKEKNFELNFQNLADLWAKSKFQRFQKHLRIAFKKGDRYRHKIADHDWKGELEKIENVYFANKAIYNHASKDIPYQTLVLLGKALSNTNYNMEVQSILKDNVMKYEGQFLKLDDPIHQNKIRKALRTFQFHKMEEFKKAA